MKCLGFGCRRAGRRILYVLMHKRHDVYLLHIDDWQREVPLVEVAPSTHIAYLDFLCDVELIEACANALSKQLQPLRPKTLVAPATGAIPLCFAIARLLNVNMVILRKDSRAHMKQVHAAPVASIAAKTPEQLILEDKYLDGLRGGPVELLDTVATSGSTFRAMEQLMDEVNIKEAARAVAFVEGDSLHPDDFIHIGHLPVFSSK
jgi:adenine/guanine phosphoribosyltransferase-like PRPP-binding protein